MRQSFERQVIRFEQYEHDLNAMFRRAADREAFDLVVERTVAYHPEGGDVIAGTGGFRKVRIARPDQPKGKRGGARVVYYYVSRARVVYLFTAYTKADADDLSAGIKSDMRKVAAALDAHHTP